MKILKWLLLVSLIVSVIGEIWFSSESLAGAKDWFFVIVPFFCIAGSILFWDKNLFVACIFLFLQIGILSLSTWKFVYKQAKYKPKDTKPLIAQIDFKKIPEFKKKKPNPDKFRLNSGGMSAYYGKLLRKYEKEKKEHKKKFAHLERANAKIEKRNLEIDEINEKRKKDNEKIEEENEEKKDTFDFSKKENLMGSIWLLIASLALPFYNTLVGHFLAKLFKQPSISPNDYEKILTELEIYKNRVKELSKSLVNSEKDKAALFRKLQSSDDKLKTISKNTKYNKEVIIGFACKEFLTGKIQDREVVKNLSGYKEINRDYNKILKELNDKLPKPKPKKPDLKAVK